MHEDHIVQAVRAVASRVPRRTALAAGTQTLTYAELERQAAAAATHIAARVPEPVVGLLLPTTPSFVLAFLGALWAGKSVAVLPTLAPAPLLKLMTAEAGVRTVVTSAAFSSRAADAGARALPVEEFPVQPGRQPAMVAHEDPAAVLLYTSGTTGRPKVVALSDRNILANAEGCRDAAGFGADEVMLAVLPLFHATGLTVTLVLPLIMGGTIVLQDRFVPRTVLQTIERHRVTCLVAIPSQYRLLAKERAQADVASLWLCISGAERLPEQVAQGYAERFGRTILQGYGATEAAPVIAMNPPGANRDHTVGRPLPNLRVTLREGDRLLEEGKVGEICVEGPNVMLGYYRRPDATAQKLVNGVLRTGDRGFLDADGYLHLVGRADDLIKVAGEKIYPAEVERALEQIAGVEEAVVVGVADEKHGAVLRAFVQPKSSACLTEADLRTACRERVEAVKVPRSFVIVEQLPRAITGKLDKRALMAQVDR